MGDLIYLLVSVVMLIIFIVMAVNVAAVKTSNNKILGMLDDIMKDTGYGRKYNCGKCKESFIGKQDKCPHCGVIVPW